MNINNSIYILGVEAKDLYMANNLTIDTRYNQTKENNDYGYKNENSKNYCNALDYSIDSIKLKEVYEKVYRNRKFSFTDGRKEYTKRVVVVKFDYSYKEYNKAAKNIYIKAGYLYKNIKDSFVDGICCDGNDVLGIEINKTIGNSFDSLPDYFGYNEDQKCYVLLKEPKCLMTKGELRQYLYKNGFTCNGIKFIRDKRSSGSSRVGKCMFIDERLYKDMFKWEKCGLSVKEGDPIDLAAFESYIALPSSSCIDTLEILPENFLVIDDVDSEFEDTVVAVEYDGDKLVSHEKKCTIKNSLFDGESIADESLFEKYPTRSMLLLRNRFFKSACFKGKIQKWFTDNNITDVSQLNGFTLAKRIEDIKIITTPSSIKYVKFGTLQQWFDNLYTTFGIVKYEKPTHYLDGKMVQCHYQLINTLQLSKDEVKELIKPSLDYVSKIRNDPDILRYHIKYPMDDNTISPLKTKNEIVFKLLGMNDKFCKTKMYYDFRNDLVRSMLSNFKEGHILINGNYSTLFGNGIEMLQHAIGTFKGESVIGIGNIHSKRFSYNTTVLGSRSPHICSGNILVCQNVESEIIDTYFDLSNEVVCVNAIGENIQQRLNGADYDSDTMMLTDNTVLINAAKKNYDVFKVPTCFVSAKKTKRFYTCEDKCDLDIKTGTNKIGNIVNLSQLLQSIMWDRIHIAKKNNKSSAECDIIKRNLDLYRDICILAVMSGIEIDKAKKEFDVNTTRELKRLKNKYVMYETEEIRSVDDNGKEHEKEIEKMIKPMFFKMITLGNGYSLNPLHIYRYFNTPMDYLQKEIGKFNFRNNRIKDEILPFSEIIKPMNISGIARSYYESRDRIINIFEIFKSDINAYYVGYNSKTKEEKDEIRRLVSELKGKCVEYLNDTSMCQYTMYLVLKEFDNAKRQGYVKLMFDTLFNTPNVNFFQLIKDTSDNIENVVENEYGTINLFDNHYIKVIA